MPGAARPIRSRAFASGSGDARGHLALGLLRSLSGAGPLGGGASRWLPMQTALVALGAVMGVGTTGRSGGLSGPLETLIRGRPGGTVCSRSERPGPTGSSRPPARAHGQQRGAGSPVPQAPLLLRKEPDPLPGGGGSWIRRTETGLPPRPGRRGGCRASGKWAGSAEEGARPWGKSARGRGALALCRPRVAAGTTATAGVVAFQLLNFFPVVPVDLREPAASVHPTEDSLPAERKLGDRE